MANHVIHFVRNGVTLDLTEDVETYDEGNPVRLNAQAVPKRHGALISEVPVYGPRQIRMTGHLYGDDKEDLRDQINTIKQKLGNTRGKVYLFDDRYYNAYAANFSYSYVPGSAMLVAVFGIEFMCDDPFGYAETAPGATVRSLTSGDTPIDVTNGIYREEFTLTNNGNEFVYLKVTVLAGASQLTNCVVRNQTISHLWQYNGIVSATKSLIVDSVTFNVTNDGVKDLANWSGSFIWLEPGSNTIQIEGSVPATYTFEYQERYI